MNSFDAFPRRGVRGLMLAGLLASLGALLSGCKLTNGGQTNVPPGPGCVSPSECSVGEALNPPDQLLGERLFKDPRFGQYFVTHSGGAINGVNVGEPTVANVPTTNPAISLPGPMAGQSMNCLQCHLVQQEMDVPGGGMRAYTNFAGRAPHPLRPEDASTQGAFTARKPAPMVDDFNTGDAGQCLHWDCEFGDMDTLVYDTLTGRDFGWLPTEQGQAVQQIARVIRLDNGTDTLAQQFSGSLPYATLFDCSDPQIPAAYRLPQQYCLNVATASGEQIAQDVANLIASYVNSLAFSRDSNNKFNGSPFDQFLILNNLPRAPAAAQTPQQYAAALLLALSGLHNPQFVNDGVLKFQHDQPFVFGTQELHGLMIFLNRPAGATLTSAEITAGGIGNCAACHTPPDFTDHLMHNTGVSQFEYDSVHGAGAFMQLSIPTLAERNADPDAYLPTNPDDESVFRSAATLANPQKTDLGVWNIFANPYFPSRQASLREFLCSIKSGQYADCAASDDELLNLAVAVFKTRTLRDLGQSDPYMHNGEFDTLTDVLKFYQQASALARAGQLRNADPRMQNIALNDADLADMAAFLASLNEDYSN
ncbi:MAG: hypothetical protein WCC11_06590 [Gammaproteobacteria bacterium]